MKYYILEGGSCKPTLKAFEKAFQLLRGWAPRSPTIFSSHGNQIVGTDE